MPTLHIVLIRWESQDSYSRSSDVRHKSLENKYVNFTKPFPKLKLNHTWNWKHKSQDSSNCEWKWNLTAEAETHKRSFCHKGWWITALVHFMGSCRTMVEKRLNQLYLQWGFVKPQKLYSALNPDHCQKSAAHTRRCIKGTKSSFSHWPPTVPLL